MSVARSKELLRQQTLLHSLLHDATAAGLSQAMTAPAGSLVRARQAYVAHAHASSQQALAASFPTVQQLIGEDSFAQMARAYWYEWPPSRGDLAWLGENLPGFIERSAQLASEPYLADTARLDWALHCCEAASDAAPDLSTLGLLGELDPAQLQLHLVPGTALLESRHPIASIWLAHHQPANQEDPFAPVRAAMAEAQAERALVWRAPWRAQIRALNEADTAFVGALLSGASLGAAMQAAGSSWNFESWLLDAVPSGLISHASRLV
jgi:Putative DNA-binding domain